MNGDEVTHAFEHNHEEADTQMVLHTTLSSEDVVFIADIDVLILMIYGYSKFMVKPIWVFRYENDKYTDIEKSSSCLGKWYDLALLNYSLIMSSTSGLRAW